MMWRYIGVLLVGIVIGIAFQRYYGVHQFLLDSGFRTIEFSETLDRREAKSDSSKKTLVILVAGQSNVANTISVLTTTDNPVYNLYDGVLYHAQDPLLGATGKGGSLWIAVSEKVIDLGIAEQVVIITVARNNSSINDWSEQGRYRQLFQQTYRQAHDLGFAPDLVIFGQGERDAIDGMNQTEYQAKLNSFIDNVAALHKAKPILLSITSRCFNNNGSTAIRNAQLQVINNHIEVKPGPDTDQLGLQYRYDGCHYNQMGRDRLSGLWVEHIASALKTLD